MLNEVKACVDARVNFLNESLVVPDGLRSTADVFVQDVEQLGESCQGAAEFESKFVSSGLAERFQAIMMQCTQKPRKMTKEEKRESFKTAKSIMKDNKEEIIGDIVSDVAGRAAIAAEGELITASRKQMIEDGTLADFTIASNAVHDAGRLARFFANKKKKK